MKTKILLIFLSMTTISEAQEWLDTSLYPFDSHFFQSKNGKIHYIDEGEGEVILFVHGTPTWSFMYREQIKVLSKNYRCIALDHLGFGLSEKVSDFKGRPQDHAAVLSEFIQGLGLNQFHLVVHDFGGPIGLSYALAHPEAIKSIVLFNTWLSATKEREDAQKIDRVLKSSWGRFLYLHSNFSPYFLVKNAFHDKSKLSKRAHLHYRKVFPNKASRLALLNLGLSLIGSSDWYAEQGAQLKKLAKVPSLIIWGTEDPYIGMDQLDFWKTALAQAQIHELQSGHFVPEEAAAESVKLMKHFYRP